MEIKKLNDEQLDSVSGGLITVDQYVDSDGNTHIKEFGVLDLCVGCGECATHCPVDAIYFDKDHNAHINEDYCVLCHNCESYCYLGVIGVTETVIKKNGCIR